MAGPIKHLFLLILIALTVPARALQQEQLSAIQDYMSERSGAGKNGQAFREAGTKLDEIEKRLLPLIFVFKRTGPITEARIAEYESLKTAIDTGQFDLNPYEDLEWLKGKGRETVQICCLIRNDQRMAQSIQENVARGYPPMTPQMMETMMAKIRQANRDGGGGLVMDDEDPTPGANPGSATSSREIPAGRFKPSVKSEANTPAKKMLDNIGYSEKVEVVPVPVPPAVPAPAPAPSAAPGTAPGSLPSAPNAPTTPPPAPVPAQ